MLGEQPCTPLDAVLHVQGRSALALPAARAEQYLTKGPNRQMSGATGLRVVLPRGGCQCNCCALAAIGHKSDGWVSEASDRQAGENAGKDTTTWVKCQVRGQRKGPEMVASVKSA